MTKAITYDWYSRTFPGGKIPDYNSFVSAVTEAEAYVDHITRGRITEVTDDVKKAVCAVAEVIYKQSQDDVPQKSGESVGNHSVSYTKQNKSLAEREAEKAMKARLYLARTGLLYGGMK